MDGGGEELPLAMPLGFDPLQSSGGGGDIPQQASPDRLPAVALANATPVAIPASPAGPSGSTETAIVPAGQATGPPTPAHPSTHAPIRLPRPLPAGSSWYPEIHPSWHDKRQQCAIREPSAHIYRFSAVGKHNPANGAICEVGGICIIEVQGAICGYTYDAKMGQKNYRNHLRSAHNFELATTAEKNKAAKRSLEEADAGDGLRAAASGSDGGAGSSQGAKRIAKAPTQQYMAEIVGEETLQGRRMAPGYVLSLVDVLAGRIAYSHCGSPCVTMAVDRVDLRSPIMHQDLVRAEGRVISVGSSSVVVEVQVYKQDLLAREFRPTQHAYLTMVALDARGVPKKGVPFVQFDNPEEEALVLARVARRKALAEEIQRSESAIDAGNAPPLLLEQVEDPLNRAKKEFLTMAETEICAQKQFLPRNLNVYNKIFGGDILEWMERVASYCARHFTRNLNMYTIAMHRVTFKKPLDATDLAEAKARVVFVSHDTVEVEITVDRITLTGERGYSHSGYFSIRSYDEAGQRRPVLTGLRLTGDQSELRTYEKAKRRHYFWTRKTSELEDPYVERHTSVSWM
eukprot:tig00000692_g3213.t1